MRWRDEAEEKDLAHHSPQCVRSFADASSPRLNGWKLELGPVLAALSIWVVGQRRHLLRHYAVRRHDSQSRHLLIQRVEYPARPEFQVGGRPLVLILRVLLEDRRRLPRLGVEVRLLVHPPQPVIRRRRTEEGEEELWHGGGEALVVHENASLALCAVRVLSRPCSAFGVHETVGLVGVDGMAAEHAEVSSAPGFPRGAAGRLERFDALGDLGRRAVRGLGAHARTSWQRVTRDEW